MSQIKVTRPGKLYLSGEYAVVEGAHAILLPTRGGLHVQIQPAARDRIESNQWTESQPLALSDRYLYLEEPWFEAYAVCERLRELKALPKQTLSIRIDSDLDGPAGSLGLGSSGALTVAMIDAYAQFYRIPLTPMQLFQLAVIAQKKQLKTSSFGDCACSAFALPLLYRRPDLRWLEQHIEDDLGVLLTLNWPGVVCQLLDVHNLPFIVVNSLVKTESSHLVAQLKHTPLDAALIFEINRLSLDLADALTHDGSRVSALIKSHHRALMRLTQPVHTAYWVHAYDAILAALQTYRFSYKTSGAGGGDNLLVFPEHTDDITAMMQHLKTAGFPILNSMIQGVWS